MLSGTNNEIYNVANDKTYCSILDMANLVSKKNKDIKVECIVDEDIEIMKKQQNIEMLKYIKEKEYIENRRFICSTCSKALIFL